MDFYALDLGLTFSKNPYFPAFVIWGGMDFFAKKSIGHQKERVFCHLFFW
jgi:hypothetical protein